MESGGKRALFAPKMLTVKHYLEAFFIDQNYAVIGIPSLKKHIHAGTGLFFEDSERGNAGCCRLSLMLIIGSKGHMEPNLETNIFQNFHNCFINL